MTILYIVNVALLICNAALLIRNSRTLKQAEASLKEADALYQIAEQYRNDCAIELVKLKMAANAENK